MEVDDAYLLISRAIDSGRVANGYLVVGDIREQGAVLVDRLLERLFPDARNQALAHAHPDIAWLEPSGRSRTIKVARTEKDPAPGIRDGIIEPMVTTSFCGGWKVGVIVGADRLQPVAANAFLKSLEEPTPKTLYFLLTDQPDAILPTIVSRTQRIDLPLTDCLLTGEVADRVADAFAAKNGLLLAAILGELKDEVDDADVALVRKSFFKTLMSFVRKMMISSGLPKYLAYRNVDAVEEAYRQSTQCSMGDEIVLSFLMDRISFPPAADAGGKRR